ncbi:MAG: M1 family metallopeptidase [Candidatus Marsarchaeota archaeon]|nr:M1 family metallopeptidase [Candidatus Marsarchaeota archaeon]
MQNQHQTLGTNVVPIRYSLEFEPNFKTFRFLGKETIEVAVREGTQKIVLNAAELKIQSASVHHGHEEERAKVSLDAKNELLTLRFKHWVSGNARITIRFTGINNDKMHGFYRSRYVDGGRARYLLTTQFEAADARRCFPCFDEPELKALFSVSMVVKNGLDCISNTPIRKTERLSGGRKRVTFHETLKMSTYLLYLGIGNFEKVRGKIGKIEETVATTKGKRSLAVLPLGYAKTFVKFYEGYFRIPYPLPKLHLLGIPDFAAGAMENWGAVTFREADLLGNDKSSIAVKQRIAEVVAHELAHQWFGDLVTMRWWDDLWLNESFATFMSYKTLAATFPAWAIGDGLLSETLDSMDLAFSADQLKATHPISTHVRDPKEISAIFDNISYDKGGAILRMIEDYAGKDAFRRGLHIYLKKHAYSNATKYDLWNAIDEAAGKRAKESEYVGNVAGYWVDNPGYPVVYASRTAKGVQLRQERFIISDGAKTKKSWPVPVHYITGSGKEGMLLFSSSSLSTKIKLSGNEFVKLNRGQKGMYRVWYDEKLLALLGTAILNKKLKGVEAWGVENDLFMFARAGKIPVRQYLSFISEYCMDCDYPTNENLLSHLAALYLMLNGTQLSTDISKLISRFANALLKRLGFERKPGESSFDTLLRGIVISSLGMIGDEHVVAKAKSIFSEYTKGRVQIDSNIKSAIFGTVARRGNAKTFEWFKKHYADELIPEEKLRFLAVLGRFYDLKLLGHALDFCLSEKVRFQDTLSIPAVASGNPHAGKLLLRWTLKNWPVLQKRYPAGTMMLKFFVGFLSSQKESQARQEIARFFARKENRNGEIVPELNRTLERIDANIKLMRVNGLAGSQRSL